MDQDDIRIPQQAEKVAAPERNQPRILEEARQIAYSSVISRGAELSQSHDLVKDWDKLSETQKNEARLHNLNIRAQQDNETPLPFTAAGLTLKYDAATDSHVMDTDGSGKVITMISGDRTIEQNGDIYFTCTFDDGTEDLVPANLVMDAMIVKNKDQYIAALPEDSAQRKVLENYAEAKASGADPSVDDQTIQEAGIEQGRTKSDTLLAFAKKNQEALGLTDDQLKKLEGQNLADAEDILMVLDPLVNTNEMQSVVKTLKDSGMLKQDFDPAQFLARQFQRHQRGESSTISGVPLNEVFAQDDLDGAINLLKKSLNILPGSKEEEDMNKLIRDSALAGAGAAILLVMFIMEAAKGLQGQQ